jgi:hypothetical protein
VVVGVEGEACHFPRLCAETAPTNFLRRTPPRRQEANRARKEAEGGPLSQAKRQWPGAGSPAAAGSSDGKPGGANGEGAEVEEGEVKATENEERADGANGDAVPEAETGGSGANAPKKARKERKQAQVREPRRARAERGVKRAGRRAGGGPLCRVCIRPQGRVRQRTQNLALGR